MTFRKNLKNVIREGFFNVDASGIFTKERFSGIFTQITLGKAVQTHMCCGCAGAGTKLSPMH